MVNPIMSLAFGLRVASAPKKRWTCPSFPGETHPLAKLTNEQVREIFKLRMQVEQPMLARRYKTQQSTISRIWHRKAWKSVTENL